MRDVKEQSEILSFVNQIKLANIVYIARLYASSAIEVLHSAILKRVTKNYILGKWELGKLAFATEGEDEIVLYEHEKSIEKPCLHDLTEFLGNDIAGIKINKQKTILDFSKKIDGDRLIVEYQVEPKELQTITKVELLNSKGLTLASLDLSLPVTNTLRLKHIFKIKEREG